MTCAMPQPTDSKDLCDFWSSRDSGVRSPARVPQNAADADIRLPQVGRLPSAPPGAFEGHRAVDRPQEGPCYRYSNFGRANTRDFLYIATAPSGRWGRGGVIPDVQRKPDASTSRRRSDESTGADAEGRSSRVLGGKPIFISHAPRKKKRRAEGQRRQPADRSPQPSVKAGTSMAGAIGICTHPAASRWPQGNIRLLSVPRSVYDTDGPHSSGPARAYALPPYESIRSKSGSADGPREFLAGSIMSDTRHTSSKTPS